MIKSLSRKSNYLAVMHRFRVSLKRQRSELHTNACGDFTLLERKNWFDLRGYPEWDGFSIHLDSVFLQMAHHAGMPEMMLNSPNRIFHIDHRDGWSPGEIARVVNRMQAWGIPFVTDEQYREWVRQMDDCKGPLVFNDENWGLAAETLPEIEVRASRVEGRAVGWATS